jgi:hypothetical protein
MCNWGDNIKTDLIERGCELDSSGSGQGPVADCFESGNETSSSIKGGEFLNKLRVLSLRRIVLHRAKLVR